MDTTTEHERMKDIKYKFDDQWHYLLHAIVRCDRPANILEIGSGDGCSAYAIASALKVTENGHLVTIEPDGDKYLNVLKQLKGLEEYCSCVQSAYQDVPDKILLPEHRWNMVVIDHEPKGDYIRALEKLIPVLADKCIVVWHDAIAAAGAIWLTKVLRERGDWTVMVFEWQDGVGIARYNKPKEA